MKTSLILIKTRLNALQDRKIKYQNRDIDWTKIDAYCDALKYCIDAIEMEITLDEMTKRKGKKNV